MKLSKSIFLGLLMLAIAYASSVGTASAQCCVQSIKRAPTVARVGGYLPDFAARGKPEMIQAYDASGMYANGVTKEKVDQLIDLYRDVFTKVKFHAEWEDDTVNAFAWVSGNQRNVAIMGGMLRHQSMGIEGISVILAHEVGHHYGYTGANSTTYPEGLYCEGQSDYWATKIGMRIVHSELDKVWPDDGVKPWPGEDTLDIDAFLDEISNVAYTDETYVDAGIAQTFAVLSGGLAYNYLSYEGRAQTYFAGCGHPAPFCRRATYKAGKDKAAKPDCAGLLGFRAVEFATITTQEQYVKGAPSPFSGRAGFSDDVSPSNATQQKLLEEIKALRKELRQRNNRN